MPAYLNDDELVIVLQACRKAEDAAARVIGAERPAAEDLRALQETTASIRFFLERAEARGKVH